MCFGGYVNGTRVNELLKFEIVNGSNIEVNLMAGGEDQAGPSCRAGASLVSQDSSICMFGGQEDDNKKMNDVWKFDINASSWSKVEIDSESFCPVARSGHSAVMFGSKMYIFGGIFELTHELNDLCCFDFETNQFKKIGDDDCTADDGAGDMGQG